jgi:hypothetical protein
MPPLPAWVLPPLSWLAALLRESCQEAAWPTLPPGRILSTAPPASSAAAAPRLAAAACPSPRVIGAGHGGQLLLRAI